MKRRLLGLRSRFIIAVLAAVGLISAGMASLSYFEARQSLLTSRQEWLFDLAQGKSNELAYQLSQVSNTTDSMSRLLEVVPDPGPLTLRRLISATISASPRVYGVGMAYAPYAYRPDKRLFCVYLHRSKKGIVDASGVVESESYNYPRHDWYLIPSLLHRPSWTEPYYGQGGGVVMTTYTVPVIKAGETRAVAVADISLTKLGRDVARMAVGRRGYAFLISGHGTFLAAPRTDWVMRESIFSLAEEMNRPDLRMLGRRMIRGGAGVERVQDWLRGEPAWLAFAPVPGVNWSFGAVVPESELFAPALELAKRQALAALGGLVALVVLIWLLVMGLTRPIKRLVEGAQRLSAGDLTTQVEGVRPGDELGELAQSFNKMVSDLNRYVTELTETTAAKQRIESELDLAHQIQQSILPRTYPAFPERTEFDLFAITQPARQVGGDFYDFFFVDQDHLGVVVGDVSGKGVGSALFMTVSRTLIKNAASHHLDPVDVLKEVNQQILPDNEMCMFVTVFYGVYELATGRMVFANAGHPPPLLRKVDGVVESFPRTGGMAVGVFDQMGLERGEVTLQPGELMLVFTDGLDEAVNVQEEMFGIERAKQWLAKAQPAPAPDMINDLVETQRRFTGDLEQFDDLTMLIFRRRE